MPAPSAIEFLRSHGEELIRIESRSPENQILASDGNEKVRRDRCDLQQCWMGNVPDFCRNRTLVNNETALHIASDCWTERRIADALRLCLPLIILPISLINNCLSFLALRSRQMRGTSTAFFMLTLSVLDPLVLLTKNFVYFPTLFSATAVTCKVLYFFIYVLGYTNVWILVIMTMDKFLAVWFPLKVSHFCTVTRAKCTCGLLFVVTSMISFHHFWTIKREAHPQNAKTYYCTYDMSAYGHIQRIWRYVDFVIWCCLPFVLLCSLSVLIIVKLNQKRTDAKKHSSVLPAAKHDLEVRSNQKADVIRSRHRHITFMLLSVAAVFLLLTLPNSIYFVLDLTYGFNKPPTANDYRQWLRFRRLNILTIIMFQLSDLQHAVNFYLYLLTSDKFRRSVVRICLDMIDQLPTVLTRSCRQKIDELRYANQKFDKSQYNMSCRSSTCGMSTTMQGSRHLQQSFKSQHVNTTTATLTTN